MKLLPLILLLLVILACSVEDEIEPTNAPIKVTAIQMSKDYKSNKLAADKKYRNMRLEVTGKVEEINRTRLWGFMPRTRLWGSVVAELDGGNYAIIICFIEKAEHDSVSKLTKGKTVTFTCIGNGMFMNGMFMSSIVYMDKCKIVAQA